MKNNKGVTLTSLVIYIALIFVVLGILTRITTYFGSNIRDMADVGFETEFNKLNLYLLDESKKTGNEILEIVGGTEITFSNGNKYSYNTEEKTIYLNESIKICENVEYCLFEKKIAQNGKEILSITIGIKGTERKEEYVMDAKNEEENIIAEEDYTFRTWEQTYQLVEHIEVTGTQYIDLGLKLNSNTKAEISFYYKNNINQNHSCILACRDADMNYTFTIWAKTNNATARYDYQSNVYDGVETSAISDGKHVIIKDKHLNYLDGIKQTSNKENAFSCRYNATLFASNNGGEDIKNNFTGNCYYCKIWDNGELVRDLIPCYRKADNVAGLYDTVNDVFYTNAGTGEFILGNAVNH